ncbi:MULTISPECIES: T9SS type A sorting domain-containing protein [Winogradskyella]|uniref:Secretion system C-terminal sorting domain-containing protein n=1 Tax=Winogradskyella damuponensis TaxID=943939 RepID=A0ABP8D1Z8_9FLAO
MKKIITNFRIFLLIGLIPIIGLGQTQIGDDIDGYTSNLLSGYSVALSNDGSVVAISSRGASNFRGVVQVFQNVDGVRTQMGNNILGEAIGDFSGASVSLSADGSVVAIGATNNSDNGESSGHVRVYKYISDDWIQVGSDIDGEALHNGSGNSVALSDDGNTVAIGAYLNDGFATNAGHVRVYENISGVWQQKGIDIDGTGSGHYSGFKVSISADGNTVAIGSPYAATNGIYHGYVKIYRYIEGGWEQLGPNIKGIGDGQCGKNVSLSADGNIVAVSAPAYSGPSHAHVRIFQYNAGTWQQIGSSINSGNANGTGHGLSISADGSIVAISSIFGSVNGANSGQVRVYQNVSNVWTQIGVNINGEAIYDQSGVGLSLSGDGSTLAIGAQYNSGNGTDAGHVRIFDLSDVLGMNHFIHKNYEIYPNPATNSLTIKTQLIDNYQFKIVNQLGQVVSEKFNNTPLTTLDVSGLIKGLYFLSINSEKGGLQTIKFIKN